MVPSRLREGQALLDTGYHGFVDKTGLAQVPLPLGVLGRSQMAQTRFPAQQLARRSHLKPLCSGFFGLSTCNGSRHGAADYTGFPVQRNAVSRGALVFRGVAPQMQRSLRLRVTQPNDTS